MNPSSNDIDHLKATLDTGTMAEKKHSIARLIELQGNDALRYFEKRDRERTPFWEMSEEEKEVERELAQWQRHKEIEYFGKEAIKLFKFCPACAEPLEHYASHDVNLHNLRCKNKHRMYIALRYPGYDYENGISYPLQKDLEAPGQTPREQARQWLCEYPYKSQIYTQQVADLLRKYLEIGDAGYSEPAVYHEKYCPICATALKKFDQDDVWVEGKVCANHHQFNSRHGLQFTNGSELHPDLTYSIFKSLINSILDGRSDHLWPKQLLNLLRTMGGAR